MIKATLYKDTAKSEGVVVRVWAQAVCVVFHPAEILGLCVGGAKRVWANRLQ